MHIFTANDSIESNKCKFNWTIFHNRAHAAVMIFVDRTAVHDNRTQWLNNDVIEFHSICLSVDFGFVFIPIFIRKTCKFKSFQSIFQQFWTLRIYSHFILYFATAREKDGEKKETKEWKPSQNCTSPKTDEEAVEKRI